MYTYTTDQIDLCRKLYEQLGEKREPQIGEWWALKYPLPKENKVALLLDIKGKSDCGYFGSNGICGLTHKRLFDFPLYSEGELLEMLIKSGDIEFRYVEEENRIEVIHRGKYLRKKLSDSILSALLKLAIEIKKGE